MKFKISQAPKCASQFTREIRRVSHNILWKQKKNILWGNHWMLKKEKDEVTGKTGRRRYLHRMWKRQMCRPPWAEHSISLLWEQRSTAYHPVRGKNVSLVYWKPLLEKAIKSSIDPGDLISGPWQHTHSLRYQLGRGLPICCPFLQMLQP